MENLTFKPTHILYDEEGRRMSVVMYHEGRYYHRQAFEGWGLEPGVTPEEMAAWNWVALEILTSL